MKFIEKFIWLILFSVFYWSYYFERFDTGFFIIIPSLYLIFILLYLSPLKIKLYKWFRDTRQLKIYSWLVTKDDLIFLSLILASLLWVVFGFFRQGYFNLLYQDMQNCILGNNHCQIKKIDRIGFGFFIAVFVGNFMSHLINKIMWLDLPKKQRELKDTYSFVNLLGILEILLYIVAIAVKQPQFIVVWIGTKVAVTWEHFIKSFKGSSHHIFLIGNALNILWACLGAVLAFGWSSLISTK